MITTISTTTGIIPNTTADIMVNATTDITATTATDTTPNATSNAEIAANTAAGTVPDIAATTGMNITKIYRRRIIPAECILLKDDIIVDQDNEVIITKWDTLNPKTSFSHGCSCYFLNEGMKLSKMYRSDNSLLRWYCDIVSYTYNLDDHALIVTDLLADVIVHPEGTVKVVDLDELAEALERNLITKEQTVDCLRSLNHLLSLIYRDKFDRLQTRLDSLGL